MPLLVASLVLSVGVRSVPAGPDPTVLDVPFYSQFDPDWAHFLIGANEDVAIRKMGSLLTCVAMVASANHLLVRFPVPGTDPSLLPTPDYIHVFLRDHDGYRPGPAKTVIMDYHALTRAFLDPLGNTSGLDFFPESWPRARPVVDGLLDAGSPSILYMAIGNNRFHPVVVVGWDEDTTSYLVLDPARPFSDLTFPLFLPQTLRSVYGSGWEGMIAGALLPEVPGEPIPLEPLIDFPLEPLIDVSAKCPVETIAVAPDGRRVGFDTGTGTTVIDVAGASYLPQPVWADPTGSLAPLAPGRLLTIPSPVDGRYRFQMVGTGEGPFALSVRARNAGGDLVVDETVRGTITAGQVVKFQVAYSSTGASAFTLGDNFPPEASAGDDRRTTVDTPVEFDGGASFDIDGTITSYQWDFGDGTTVAGQAVSHAYAAPGTYTVTLTVTDDLGATGSDTSVVSVFSAATPTAGTTERVSEAMGGIEAVGTLGSFNPSLGADGRLVAFDSRATNLGGAVPGFSNVFVRDRQTGTIEPTSPPLCVFGSRMPALSGDGRFVAFECSFEGAPGTAMSGVVVRDRATGALERVDVSGPGEGGTCMPPGCGSFRPAISADGRFVAFYSDATNLVPGDTNDNPDVFVRDRLTGTTERISVPTSGVQSALGATNRAGEHQIGLSADGRFVAFSSLADDLVAGLFAGRDRIFVRDRRLRVTELVSVSGAGIEANSDASRPSISADGRFVAFASFASNLVPGDTNAAGDVFVRDRVAATTERVSVSDAGAQAVCSDSARCNRDPVISSDGRFVVFRSMAANLVLNDANGTYEDVFIRDRQAPSTELVSLSTEGQPGNGQSGEAHFTNDETRMAVSAGGGIVAFVSDATNLVAFDNNGLEDVFVRDRQPSGLVADPSGPYIGWATTVDAPASITFDASKSFDPTGGPLVARWDFGDGSRVTVADAGTPVPHAYASPGTYPVTLVVSSDGRDATQVATVASVLPPLRSTMTMVPACGRPGDRINATIAGHQLVSPAGGWDLGRAPLPTVRSVYPDGDVRVSFAGPAGGDLADQRVPIEERSADLPLEFSTRFSFTVGDTWVPGTYTVHTPDDGGGSSGFTVPCPSLTNEPPRADSGGPYQGTVGLPVVLDGRSSADPEGMPLTFSWFFEDGGTASGPRPSYTFLAPGTYWALLVVNDGVLGSPTSAGTGSYTIVTITGSPETTTSTTATTSSTTSTTSVPTSTPSSTSSTTTSTSPTTPSEPTTSTTMPPESDPCATAPAGPTFRSLTCRLATLLAQTGSESALGNQRGKLLATLAKAKERTELAEAGCADGQRKRPALRLRQAGRRLIRYDRRLRTPSMHETVPEHVREPLAQTAERIRADAETLRRALRCPDDASRPSVVTAPAGRIARGS